MASVSRDNYEILLPHSSSYGAAVVVSCGIDDIAYEEEMDDPQLGVSTQTLVSSKGEFQSAKRLPQYLAAISVTIGAFALGNVLAWTSPTADELSQTTNNNFTSTLMTQSEWSWVGSLMNIGAALVVLPVGYLIDKIGRKFTMLGLVFPFTAGWFLMVWAKQTVPLYYVGRIVTGMMGGAFSLTAPVYVSEIAESDIRGTLGTYFQLMVTVGILFVYVLGSQENRKHSITFTYLETTTL
uniref:Major facilitator superfamily (MFS) profile domain-containing protein n=1 Tax=Timema tahoe TaxID=61484 RepID=A0A7R9FG00_9NEOP|nr:unnamed protein product [Timema tahoe]